MKRPLCVTGFSMLFALFLLCKANPKAIGAVCLAALIAFVVSLFIKSVRRDKTLPTAFLSIAVAGVLLLSAGAQNAALSAYTEAKSVYVEGSLSDLPYRENGRYYYVLRTSRIGENEASQKVRLVSSAPLDLTPRDTFCGDVRMFLLGDSAQDDEITAYYRSTGLVLGAYPTGETQITRQTQNDLYASILSFRQSIVQTVLTALPGDCGALITGISLGAADELSGQATNAFRVSGVSHLLVVSGLHLTTWSMLLLMGLQKLGFRRRQSAVFGIGFVLLFVVLTGAAPSVVRAAVMLGVVYAADLFRREAEPLNSIGLALTGMLVVNPFAARSLSLLLSVFSTVGILLFAKPIEAFLNRPAKHLETHKILLRVYHFVTSVVSVTFAVTVCTLPIQLWAFGTFSLVSLPANLLLLTAGSACMVCGLLGAVFSLCGLLFLGNPLLFCAAGLSRYLLAVTGWFANSDFAVLPVNSAYAKLLLAVAFFAAAVFLLWKSPPKKLRRAVCTVLVGLFLFSNLGVYAFSERALRLTAVDVGDGIAVVLRCQGETVVLGAGGDYYADSEICAILSAYGATHIDALVLPASGDEYISAAKPVSDSLATETVYYAPELRAADLSFGEQKIPIDKTVLSLANGDLTVAVQSKGNYRYAEIRYGAFRALVSFSAGNNFQGDGASVLISAANTPQNILPADFGLVILSVADASTADFLSAYGGNVCTTAENGSISVLARPNGDYQYQRSV